MKIYFVRHGQTEDDAAKIFQNPSSVLSSLGIKQAEALGKRFKKIPVEIILTSPYQRAKETAEIISKEIKKEIVVQDLLSEFRKPPEIEHKSLLDPEMKRIRQLLYDHFCEPDWHYSNEENFFDLKKRSIKLLKYLSDLKYEDILVVSHGAVIRMVFTLMMFKEDFRAEDFLAINKFYIFENTGISIAVKNDKGYWQMEAWNDTTHL